MSNPRLLPPNASALERGLVDTGADLTAIDPDLRQLWNPATIRADLLPWLAWGLSIDSWKSYWQESVKRARVASAIPIARRKGTAQSVRDVVAAFGGYIEIREWWQQSPKGIPHTFDLVLTLSGESGQTATAEFVNDVIGEINRTKPARSHFTFTQGLHATGSVGVVAVARAITSARLSLQEAT